MDKISQKLITFITLPGTAEEAMNFYVDVFGDAKIISVVHYDETDEDMGSEKGKVINGLLEISGQQLMFMDMAKKYLPDPTWNISLMHLCETEAEFDTHFAKLSDGGSVMMGPEPVETPYEKLRKVTWVTDKFGVTWQLVWV